MKASPLNPHAHEFVLDSTLTPPSALAPRSPLRHASAPGNLQNLSTTPPPRQPTPNTQSWNDAMWLLHQGANQGLVLAAISGMNTVVRSLLESGYDVNARNEHGHTPLHAAAGMGRAELIHTLVAHGAELDVKCHQGKTPLMLAIERAHGDAALQLLTLGADPNTCDDHGKSAIQAAQERGLSALVKALERLGTQRPSGPDDAHRDLMWAIEMGQASQVRTLAHAVGAAWDKTTGKTALHFAATFNNLDVVRALIISGLNPNTVDARGNTPMHDAARVENENMMHYLAQVGGFTGVRNGDGLTPSELLGRVRRRHALSRSPSAPYAIDERRHRNTPSPTGQRPRAPAGRWSFEQ